MSSAWFRMDQLLKCGICSERFRNPKLLPCNHTFCGEPCLERLAERGSRQNIKCPECSAEHRVPGQGFPHNVTLGRFLELRQQVSGHEPELPASMQRCNACGEKGRLEHCAHCKRKICPECRKAHVNILRKEVALINAQCREGLGQLCRALHDAEDNAEKLQKNYVQVRDEIEEVVRRYTHDLLGAESRLKQRLDAYLQAELKSMRRLEHDLQIELGNVHSNCDLVEKFVNNGVDWTDAELTDYKEIFQKTLDFLRAFDSDPTSDCVRKVRFKPREDPDLLHKTLLDFAEVRLTQEEENEQRGNSGDVISMNGGPTLTLTPPQNSLFRSQSDHKLGPHRNSQKRTNDRSEETEPLSRRLRDRFGTRDSCERESAREHSPSSWRNSGKNGRDHDRRDGGSDEQESSTLEDSSVNGQPDHVTETEDATRGPLSGVIRILDSPHVMERLHNSEVKQKKQREEEERKANLPPPAPPPVPRLMTRQMSEDEIEKQKKENKAAAAAAASNAASNKAQETTRSTKTSYGTKDEDSSRSYTPKYTTPSTRNSTEERRGQQREETSSPRLRNWRTGNLATERDVSVSPPGSPTRGRDKPPVSPRGRDLPSRPQNRPFLTKSSSLEHEEPERRSTTTSSLASKRSEERPRLRLNIPPRSATPPSSSSNSSSSSESEDEAEHEAARKGDISPSVNTLLARSAQARKQSASTQARILGQDNKERRSWRDAIRKEEEPIASSRKKTSVGIEPEPRNSKYSSILDRTRRSSITSPTTGGSRTAARDLSPEDSYTARRNRIARSKSSHDLYPAEEDNEEDTLSAIRNRYRNRRTRDKSPEEPAAPHSWSQYLKNKYGTGGRATTSGGLVRSMTSASLAAPRSGSDSSDEDHPPRRRDYGRSRGDSNSPRGFSMPRRTYMQKGKTSLKFGSRGTENAHFTWPRGVCVGPDNTIVVADSNNHRVQVFSGNGKFLHSFGSYGTGEGEFDSPAAVTCNRIGQYVVSDRYNHRLQVFDSTGRFVRAFGGEGRADGKFSYPWGVATDNLGFVYVCDKDNHRIQVFQGDGTFVTKFGGGPGHRPGELHHPHYVAVSTTSRVVVSDADNHRVQAFDVNGRLLSTFGSEGGEEAQFKYPRGVAVDEQGYLVVGDSGNNRIQVFHPDGTFLKSFGTWGSAEGEFKGLEGVAVTQSGQILVCDRENHRIQVF